jgi:hypothetical protein
MSAGHKTSFQIFPVKSITSPGMIGTYRLYFINNNFIRGSQDVFQNSQLTSYAIGFVAIGTKTFFFRLTLYASEKSRPDLP